MRKETEIIERNGKLFILDAWISHFTKPIQYRTAWPTGLYTSDFPQFIGQHVKLEDYGVARFADGTLIGLENRGETRPVAEYCEERPIPKPRGAREYRNGQWYR